MVPHEERKSAGATVLCGHWSTLDLMLTPNVLMLDSGCLWGGALTAIRLDDRRVFQVPGRAGLQSRTNKRFRPRATARADAAPGPPASASSVTSTTIARSPSTRQNELMKLVSPT